MRNRILLCAASAGLACCAAGDATFLTTHRLPHSTAIGRLRFVAETDEEKLITTFGFWNVLDRIMFANSRSNWQMGYVRENQVRRMIQLVSGPDIRTYCEIGMNGGHSAVAMLLSNQNLTVHSFDLFEHEYAAPVVHLLNQTFGHRFISHPGDSRRVVPPWVSEHAGLCDVLLVDGDHSMRGAVADLQNFRRAAAPSAPVIVDDVAAINGNPSGPKAALASLNASGELAILETYGPYRPGSAHNPCTAGIRHSINCVPWGYVIAQYVRDFRSRRS